MSDSETLDGVNDHDMIDNVNNNDRIDSVNDNEILNGVNYNDEISYPRGNIWGVYQNQILPPPKTEIGQLLDRLCHHIVSFDFKPRLSIENLGTLFRWNEGSRGSLFIIQQHDALRAGLHWDLRLQLPTGTTLSFAIPKGFLMTSKTVSPRTAIETTFHEYNYGLVEDFTPSGPVFLWDCGEYQCTYNDSTRHNNYGLAQMYQRGKIDIILRGARLSEYHIHLHRVDKKPTSTVVTADENDIIGDYSAIWYLIRRKDSCTYEEGPVINPRESQRSIVTGRTVWDICRDSGVNDWVPKRGWAPTL